MGLLGWRQEQRLVLGTV